MSCSQVHRYQSIALEMAARQQFDIQGAHCRDVLFSPRIPGTVGTACTVLTSLLVVHVTHV